MKGDPALVNTSSEDDGWMIKVRVEDASDLGKSEKYDNYCYR